MGFAWSYSGISTWETCPNKYAQTKVTKKFKEVFSGGAAQYGQDAHKAFEMYLKCGDALPLDLIHHKKYLDKIAAVPGEGVTEQRIALTRELEPTGFFDSDCWVRGILDYLKMGQDKDGKKIGIVIDWKSGKQKDDFEQIELACCIVSRMMPEINEFRGAYYWMKTKKFTWKTFTRDELDIAWETWRRRANAMEDAIKACLWPPKPNGLCNKYCIVTDCRFNSGYTGEKSAQA